jgi:NhaP-type Na+/H+ or K+/H+ antiporter
MVALSVAVILFEGGLTLKVADLKESETLTSVRRLVLLGSLITWASVTFLAIHLLGFRFELALLLGAILVVTGPTVILPLLRQVGLRGRVGVILKWEGMINDPLGAVLAVVVFEAIRGGELTEFQSIALTGIVSTLLVAVIGAVVMGALLAFCLRRFWVPDHLQAPLALATALLLYGLSDLVQAESGLASVTLMGIYLAHVKGVSIRHIRGFKENLSVLLISTLFIVLSARLEWSALVNVKASWLVFVALVVLLVRPLAVLACTARSGLSWKEKAFLCAIGPRGIVAAAIASVFALQLEGSNYPGAENLMVITFLVIAGSVAFSGLTARPLASYLELAQPGKGGLLMVGAHPAARCLAKSLREGGVEVTMVDTNSINVYQAEEEGFKAIRGDILSNDLQERLDFGELGSLLALLANDEVNTLAVLKYREIFGRANVFRITSKRGTNAEAGRSFAGLTRPELEEAWKEGNRPRVCKIDPENPPSRPLVKLGQNGHWEVVDGEPKVAEGDRIIALT